MMTLGANVLAHVPRCLQRSKGPVSRFSSHELPMDAVIVSLTRTPIGKLGGPMSALSGPRLGSIAIKGAVEEIEMDPSLVEEVYMGNVLSAGIGQAPARQAALYAAARQAILPEFAKNERNFPQAVMLCLPLTVPCTTVNKVCASGMKAVMLAAQSISSGYRSVVVAGGFESMSNVPYMSLKARKGLRLGHDTLVDGIIHDGLWDVYNDYHMGFCGEICAEKYGIGREEQDAYAIESYKRAEATWSQDKLSQEITPVMLPSKKDKGEAEGIWIVEDEEYKNVDLDKLKRLRPVFKKDGTVTAANASTVNDGAAAMVLMSASRAKELGLRPLARIRGYADAARAPEEFTVAPSDAVPLALKRAGMTMRDIEYHEINEAFSVVALANIQLMELDPARVNVNGGAVSLGHPIGASGARILCTLYTVLKEKEATMGCASICNGGGGASALIMERLV